MTVLSAVSPVSVAAVVLFVGLLVFVHELGHFLAAKYFDIKVLRFSLGFGPVIFSFERGETTYQIAAFPIGGFVRMAGDNPAEEVPPEDRDRAFTTAPRHQRAAIALAGPAFNLLFPVLCFFAYNVLGPTVQPPMVGTVLPGSPAERAGLQAGDRVVSVDDENVHSFERLQRLLRSRPHETAEVEVLRDGERKKLRIGVGSDFVDRLGKTERVGQIGIVSSRQANRIGIFRSVPGLEGLRPGDRILRVGDQEVSTWAALEGALRGHAGQSVSVEIERSVPQTSGDVFLIAPARRMRRTLRLPGAFETLADLGLGSAAQVLRFVRPGGPAHEAGLQGGDFVTAVDGKPIALLASAVRRGPEAAEPVVITVVRDGTAMDRTLVPRRVEVPDPISGRTRPYYDLGLGLGARPPSGALVYYANFIPYPSEKAELSLLESLRLSVRATGELIVEIFQIIVRLFSREISPDHIGSPLQLFQVAADAAEVGVHMYLLQLAFISVNLGLVNLLPIPIFDGGHLLFVFLETVRRKPLSLRAREAANLVGLILIAMLFIYALKNDLKSFGWLQ